MHIHSVTLKGRKAWQVDNDALTLTIMQGGGHIASITGHENPRLNPLWTPVWPTIEPWRYGGRDARRYGNRLLACIGGHNVCLGWFGDPSPEEAAAGMVCHGEAPVARWKRLRASRTRSAVSLTCGCDLPAAQMRLTRTVTSRRGSRIFDVRDEVRSLARRDLPFTMCQHVTLGPPFLEKGVTVFDMPATRGHTFPGAFGRPQRLQSDAAFRWPLGPGRHGKPVDLRTIGREFRASSDFSAQLMDPAREEAWFSAVNPRLGLLLAYVWKRADYPWLGNWEENYGRKGAPWGGRSLTRGMEFANTPFPEGLRRAVDRGAFHGRPAFRWLPARGRAAFDYRLAFAPVPPEVKGVAGIRREGRELRIDLRS